MNRSQSYSGGGNRPNEFEDMTEEPMARRYSHVGYSHWWSKVMEVVPVLAVVALTVMGTVLYLTIVDGGTP